MIGSANRDETVFPDADLGAVANREGEEGWGFGPAASVSLPVFDFPDVRALRLPNDCALVGVELTEDAVDLPSFHHPRAAAYVLGPERGVLSPELVAKCQHLVRIPTTFSLNPATAGAIVMYDRIRALGRFAPRPVSAGAEPTAPAPHVQGPPKRRRPQA